MSKSNTLKVSNNWSIFLFSLGLMFSTLSINAQVTLANQPAVDNFPATVTHIKGSLTIGGSSAMSTITNLNPLSNIVSVGGDLNIAYNGKLSSLSGLGNIRSVGGRIYITNNTKLSDCISLFDLVKSRIVIISNNDKGCNSVEEIEGEINRCGGLVNNVDSDGDGIVDCADACPDNPYKTVNDACGCDGGYAGDSDGDGTIDCEDECPNDRNKIKAGNCGCGNSETPDSDGDGVYDCEDACPNNPYLSKETICSCEAPTILNVSMSNRSACNDQGTNTGSDDTYQATVKVEFAWPPQLGAIRFKGATNHRFDFSNENEDQTEFDFDLIFPADGQKVDFTVEYIGNETCFYQYQQATALAPCSDLVCDMPTNITPVIDGNQVRIAWDYVADWMSYEYKYRQLGTSEWTHQWTDQIEATICDLELNQTYEYSVRAYCGANRKSVYSKDLFTTTATATVCEIASMEEDCVIQNVEILDVRRCHDRGTAYQGDDFFYADVVVYFQGAPRTGTLNLTGNTVATVATSALESTSTYTFKQLKVMENFGEIDLTASFSEKEDCRFNIAYPISINPCLAGQGRSRVEDAALELVTAKEVRTLSLYPNPVSDVLTVNLPALEQGQLIVFNVLGEQVLVQELQANKKQVDLPIVHLEKGIYQLVIQYKNRMISEQFIKN